MKRGILILGMIVLFASPVFALRDDLYLTRLSFADEYVHAGDYLVLFIELNDEIGDVREVKVVVYVSELEIRQSSKYYTIESEEIKWIYVWIPKDAPKGEYLARISVYSDDENHVRRIKHRFFYVL